MKIPFGAILLLLAFSSCEDKMEAECTDDELIAPQIILVVGQSNTHAGYGLDANLDAPQDGIYQLGRSGSTDNCVIQACEPLEHHTKTEDRIGFALTFAKLLQQHAQGAGDIIIVPCGFGGTGFADNRWNRGNDLYDDAIFRTNGLLEAYPEGRLVAILWHQGETDVYLNNTDYDEDLDRFILDLRADLGDTTVPFVLGGMVPYWVDQAPERQMQQQILKDTPLRNGHVAYADPEIPFLIEKSDNTFDEIHFDANGQRELGQRYFDQFLTIVE
jgi:hypothetical protein